MKFEKYFFCFVGRAFRYICVIKPKLDAPFILSLLRQSTSTCFGNICSPPSGGIPYVYIYIYITIGKCCANRQSIAKHNTYQLLYIYSVPPDDGLQICSKHVEVD